MKAVFFIKTLTGLRGGAENVMLQIAIYLRERAWEVSVVTFDSQDGESCYPLNGIEWIRLGIGNSQEKTTLINFLLRIIRLRKVVQETRPDVAVGFMHSMFILLAFATLGTRIPLVASEHTVPAHYKKRKVQYLLFLAATPFLRFITASTDLIKSSYPSLISGKMVVIPNPINLFRGDVMHHAEKKGAKVILAVGRFDKQKDLATLIYSFSLLAFANNNWLLKIVGDGAERLKLEKLIALLELEHKVELVGAVPYSNIPFYYHQADIFAMPSLYEAFPLALLEAMACGVPAIGFNNCPGVNEIIRDGVNGILVDEGVDRVKSFASGLSQLMANDELRSVTGVFAREAAESYSINSIGEVWRELLERAAHSTAG